MQSPVTDSWSYRPPTAPLSVVHEDRDTVAVAKPSGLLSVPGRAEVHRDSAQSRIEATRGRVYPVHRLDLDTSGLLLMATRRKAERELFRQFREREVQKSYVAWVAGRVEPDDGVVDLPLARIPGMPRSKVCAETGRAARTRFRVQHRTARATCLHLVPETGRSHQLRVHLHALGHPILGDRFYAPPPVRDAAPRLLLHAWTLTVAHPFSGDRLHLVAPLPFSRHSPTLEPCP